ncbi:cyclic GMP-AMP synthase-like [Stylophora pistillata]|uniref:cyclic GMP-AMP synthase-like n=1 Tax=Stylophora pistillata TaxID=50429 RepID=UPI000C04FF22|nr:cyclic GMP-AMP synthase-like [Stylophora pistillata]
MLHIFAMYSVTKKSAFSSLVHQIMAQAEERRGDTSTLTKKLRDFSVKYVKISEEDMTRARKLVKKYIEDRIIMYCRENSKIQILKLEYTGSFYERLKTEAADEVDIMVVMKTQKEEIEVIETEVPGFVLLMARESSVLRKYAWDNGCISPKRIRDLWFSHFQQAVNYIHAKPPLSEVSVVLRNHGPAIKLDIEKDFSADLVPCFQVEGNCYVPKPLKGKRFVSYPELFWRQSFSVKEKQVLQSMDRKDNGCRHELLRIVKTVVKRPQTSLPLDSYYLKTAFLHYIKKRKRGLDWVSRDALGKHFINFLKTLQIQMERGSLPHYWVSGSNLLEDFKGEVIKQMANRLRKILESEQRLNQILE